MKTSFVVATAIAVSLGGCDDNAVSTRQPVNARQYTSIAGCLHDNYYAAITCESGKFVARDERYLPEVRAYANKQECLADGFYSALACGTVREMFVEMTLPGDQAVLAPPLAATFPVPR